MKNLLKKIRKSHKGFTLVELIIVIAIIAVLTAVLAPQYVKYVDRSKNAADQNTSMTLLHEVEVAIVDVTSSGGTVADQTITMDGSGTSSDKGDSDSLVKALTEADANWENAKSARGNTYTIKVTGTGATGTWDSDPELN